MSHEQFNGCPPYACQPTAVCSLVTRQEVPVGFRQAEVIPDMEVVRRQETGSWHTLPQLGDCYGYHRIVMEEFPAARILAPIAMRGLCHASVPCIDRPYEASFRVIS